MASPVIYLVASHSLSRQPAWMAPAPAGSGLGRSTGYAGYRAARPWWPLDTIEPGVVGSLEDDGWMFFFLKKRQMDPGWMGPPILSPSAD